MSNDTVEEIEASLTREADIASFVVVDEVNDEALVRVKWEENLNGLLEALARDDGVILDASGGDDVWRFQIRFPHHVNLTDFYRRCTELGIPLDLQSVHNPGPPTSVGLEIDLSDPQYDALQIALEEGYFDVPRRINLVDLADELGISDTATSQRLRRGIKALLEATLAEEPESKSSGE